MGFFFLNFTQLLVELQFLGYKFGLKGSTYTRENTVGKMKILFQTLKVPVFCFNCPGGFEESVNSRIIMDSLEFQQKNTHGNPGTTQEANRPQV